MSRESAISARLRTLIEQFPDAPTVLFEEQSWSWGFVGRMRSALDELFNRAGVAEHEPVGLILRERPTAFAALLALWASNRCVVLISSHLPDAGLHADVRALQLPAVVADQADWNRAGLLAAASQVGTLGLQVQDDHEHAARIVADPPPGPDASFTAPDGTAVAVLTSGTTGTPKRVPVPYSALDAAAERVSVADPTIANGVTINVLPLTTIGGVRGIAETVWRGRPFALMERFDVWRWAALVRNHRPRRIGVPPAVLRTILNEQIPADWLAGVECLITGSAPLHVPTVRQFVAQYGIPVLNAYGSTEFGGRVAQWTLQDWAGWHDTKLGSVGRPMPHVNIRVTNPDDGAPLAAGDTGLLEVQFTNGADRKWVRTNDFARLDADGFLWLFGRADDVIIRGGFKVPIGEIEETLEQHPGVAEAIAVGLDDERLGQVPAVAVTLEPGTTAPSEAQLLVWLRERLLPYKVPRIVVIVDEIPRNAMLKPLRGDVKRLLASYSNNV